MITFVSAFLDLSEDRTALRSFETYITEFKKLAETGIPIHLFLNKQCAWYTCEYPNVHIEYIELDEECPYDENNDYRMQPFPRYGQWKKIRYII